ncbi:MAG: hypothetical protein R3A79_07745 [Nannocystaceae bacterium]
MPYYGHRSGCVRLEGGAPYPDRIRAAWWVCTLCLHDFVPKCSLCAADAPIIDRQPGYAGYAYGKLCAACVTKVKAAGPWRTRRAAAVAARRDHLCERYPTLAIVKETRAVTQLEGEVRGRLVEIRLRTKTREYSSDRYIFHVERAPTLTEIRADDLGLPEAIATSIAPGSPSLTQARAPWLRVAFLHLGKLDVGTVLEALLDRVGAEPVADDPAPADDGAAR